MKEKTLVIKGGTLIDGTGNDPLENSVVIIQDSKIIEVGEKVTTPHDSEVLDVSGKIVMPGMIDGHVHLNADPFKSPIERLHAPDSMVNLRAAKNAKIALQAGFTSILGNCGYGNYADIFLKEAIDNGWLPGPRLYTAGPGITSSLRRGINRKYGIFPQPHTVADGVEEVRKMVRNHIANGVDWLKVLGTFAVGSPNSEPSFMNLTKEDLVTIVKEAHYQRKKVKVHLEGVRTTKEAIEAGIDIVLHGFFLDEEDVETMVKKGIAFIPTLAWRGELVRTGAPGQPDWYLRKAQSYGENHIQSFKNAYEAGVLIAAGTDCSGGGSAGDFLRHGENAKEMEYLVKNGQGTMDAIVAGTNNVAKAYGVSGLIGTVEPGKLADIIIVNGNPLKDIEILQEKSRIEKVIKNGEIVVENEVVRSSICPPLKPYPVGYFAGNNGV
jgi:imidazolonepropionase-like amidohydrolase